MTTRADFEDYLEHNPNVWPTFERFALEAARRGKKIGAKAIFERMRWEISMEDTPGDEWAIFNNTYVSWYARRFQEAHPGYGQIFVTRKSQADTGPAPTTVPSKGGAQYRDVGFGPPTQEKGGQGLIAGTL